MMRDLSPGGKLRGMRFTWHLSTVVGLFFLMTISSVEAQRYRYMDSSGNLHFVETLNDVPRQYRQQIVPATPTPVLDARQKKEIQRTKERELRERQRQIENKKRELERARRSIERDQKVHASRVGGGASDQPKSQQPVAREDQIEVIR